MSKPAGYTRTQIALHWVIFLLVAAQYLFHDAIVAAWRAFGQTGNYEATLLGASHVFGGILILLLALWRIRIKIRRGSPPLPENEPRVQQILAHATHGLIYLLLLLMPLSGIAAWFGGVKLAADAHSLLRLVFLLLILLHILGALYHRFVLKSGVMQRMMRPE